MANKLRVRLAEAQNWRCAYCSGLMKRDGAGPELATRDHLQPVSRSGQAGWANCVAACAACNSIRGRTYSWTFWKERKRAIATGEWPSCTWAAKAVARSFKALERANLQAWTERKRLQRLLENRGVNKDLLVGHDGTLFRIRRVRRPEASLTKPGE